MFFAYILQCADGRYYADHTDDLERRIAEHETGALPGFTRPRRPLRLRWSETFQTREEALAVEKRIKGWTRAKKEALIEGDWEKVQQLASRAVLRGEASPGSASPQDKRSGENEPTTTAVRPEDGLSAAEGPSRRAAPNRLHKPIIVLVRPQLGENIGKAARAMLNFGLTEMRLVAPRDGWPNPAAGPAASGADIVLEHAQVFDSVTEAVADCANIYATTVRKRGITKPVVTPAEAAGEIHASPARTAILFGPERSGLETDDVALARSILTVPINPEFGSLNLAQAVILVAYEWSKGEALAQPPQTELDPPAEQAELDGLIAHLEGMLDSTGYFFPPDRVPATRRTLRGVLTKPGWNAQEIRTLRGVLSSLERGRPR